MGWRVVKRGLQFWGSEEVIIRWKDFLGLRMGQLTIMLEFLLAERHGERLVVICSLGEGFLVTCWK